MILFYGKLPIDFCGSIVIFLVVSSPIIRAMVKSFLESLVNKVLMYKWKLITMDTIKSQCKMILWSWYNSQKVYKMIYHLKNKWYLIGLKKDIFFVKGPDFLISDNDIVDKFYWLLVKKHCSSYVMGKWYIGGLKALELHTMNFSCPDDILIVNEHKQSTEVVLFDKKLLCKKYSMKGRNLFSSFYRQSERIKIANNVFYIANLELSLLESLYSPDVLSWGYCHDLIRKLVRKQWLHLRLEILAHIVALGKHHTSINRLYDIARSSNPQFAQDLLTVIKKHSFVMS